MVWTNEDVFLREVTREFADSGDVPVFGIGGESPYPPGTKPVVIDVSPTPGTVLTNTATPVLFKLYTQGVPIRRGIVCVMFPGMQLWEIAHNGDSFTEKYLALSTRTAITDATYGDGWQFSLLRDPIWPDGPTIYPFFTNEAGEENV